MDLITFLAIALAALTVVCAAILLGFWRTSKNLAVATNENENLKQRLAEQEIAAEEKLGLLDEAKEKLKLEFKVVAGELLTGHSNTFKEQNKEQIEGLLKPLRERIETFNTTLGDAHKENLAERVRLAEQIKNMTQTSTEMLSETANLTRALKGDSKTQGMWGEMVVERILEQSGLRKGHEYAREESVVDEDGKRLRPDFIVHLPNKGHVIIDSKVSLTAYEAFVNETDEFLRAEHLSAHVQSVRTHIKSLSDKKYHHVSDSPLDYVILFMPIEGALASALEADPGLTAAAAEKNVPIATPTTLMIALRTIANIWLVERRNQNAEEIARKAGTIYEKFVGFTGDMESIGKRLDQARDSYDDAIKKLSTGRGNVLRQVEQLKQLGAKTSKSIPSTLLADVDEPVEEADADTPTSSNAEIHEIPLRRDGGE